MNEPEKKKSPVASTIGALVFAVILVYASHHIIDPDDPLGGSKQSEQRKATKEK